MMDSSLFGLKIKLGFGSKRSRSVPSLVSLGFVKKKFFCNKSLTRNVTKTSTVS